MTVWLRPISATRTAVSGSVLGAQSSPVAPHGQASCWPMDSGTARIGWTASQNGQRAVIEHYPWNCQCPIHRSGDG